VSDLFEDRVDSVVAGGAALTGPGVTADVLNRLQAEAMHRLFYHLLRDLEAVAKKLRRAGFTTGL
jgi:hypothetical protein